MRRFFAESCLFGSFCIHRRIFQYTKAIFCKGALCAIFPLSDSCCKMDDARQLFRSCIKSNDTLFDEYVAALRLLGLASASSSNNSECLCRASFFTVQVHAIVKSHVDYDKPFFQLLHGVVMPLLFERISAASLPSNYARHAVRDEVSVLDCLEGLQHPRGTALSAWRFVPELVHDALLAAVREGWLRPAGVDTFRFDTQNPKCPSIVALYVWWRRHVEPFARRRISPQIHADPNLRNHETGEATKGEEGVSLNDWMESVQDRARCLLDRRDPNLPIILASRNRAMAEDMIAVAARCWGPKGVSKSKEGLTWQLHLTDSARATLAVEVIRSIKKNLARRPAGISLSDLSNLIAWPALAPLLRLRGLRQALERFPLHFGVAEVHGVIIVQHRGANLISPLEAADAWFNVSCSSLHKSPPSREVWAQQVDLVVRAVAFLRKRHRRSRSTTFAELLNVLLPQGDQQTSVLSTLLRFDVITNFGESAITCLESLAKREVQLSAREVLALEAMEMYKSSTSAENRLYSNAIKPFLLCCAATITASSEESAKSDENKDNYLCHGFGSFGSLSFTMLERWLQWDRLGRRVELSEVLKRHVSDNEAHFMLKISDCCVQLGEKSEMERDNEKVDPQASVFSIAIEEPPPPPPPPPITTTKSPELFTYEMQLVRVLRSHVPAAQLHFAQSTMHAVFGILLPIVSTPSGVRMDTLQRRLRWGPLVATLGTLSSFIHAYDGLFFDIYRPDSTFGAPITEHDASMAADHIIVSAYRGPVGPFLMYARLIARLFPSDVDTPLRLIAEGLGWATRFSTRFGDLPGYLRHVGRTCHGGIVLALTPSTYPVEFTESRKNASPTTREKESTVLWNMVKAIRQGYNGEEAFTYINPNEIQRIASDVNLHLSIENSYPHDLGEKTRAVQLAEVIVRRFPLFFSWDTKSTSPRVSLVLPHAPATNSLVLFVESYICPLLHEDVCTHVRELDERLGWSRGDLDFHPGVPVKASEATLWGVLRRYVESVHHPKLVMDENGVLRPNTAIYSSPEDMLREINGLKMVKCDDGSMRLQPLGRPVSLFELIAQEVELCGGLTPKPREECWYVLSSWQKNCCEDWEKELSTGRTDILVWSDPTVLGLMGKK